MTEQELYQQKYDEWYRVLAPYRLGWSTHYLADKFARSSVRFALSHR